MPKEKQMVQEVRHELCVEKQASIRASMHTRALGSVERHALLGRAKEQEDQAVIRDSTSIVSVKL